MMYACRDRDFVEGEDMKNVVIEYNLTDTGILKEQRL